MTTQGHYEATRPYQLGIDVDGSLVSVRVALAGGVSVTARVTASAWADLGLGVGDSLWVSVKATQVRAIPVAVGS